MPSMLRTSIVYISELDHRKLLFQHLTISYPDSRTAADLAAPSVHSAPLLASWPSLRGQGSIPGVVHEFFLGSVTVAGALTGLLFVALSVAASSGEASCPYRPRWQPMS